MNKWRTVKILSEIVEEIKPMIDSGKFSSIPDFVTYSIRKELENERR